jgi:hypothetical protein
MGDAAQALAVIVSILTYVGVHRRERRLKRAELVQTWTRALIDHPALMDTFLRIDHQRFKLSEMADCSPIERNFISLMDLLNSICYHRAAGVIKRNDLKGTSLSYAIARTYANSEVQAWLKLVGDHDASLGLDKQFGFYYFKKVGREMDNALQHGAEHGLSLFGHPHHGVEERTETSPESPRDEASGSA